MVFKSDFTLLSAIIKENFSKLYLDCKTLQLWLLSRHGTRHPAAKIIDKLSNLTDYMNVMTENSTLCKEDIEAIKSWKFNLTKTDGNKLNMQGVHDIQSLGIRLQNVYKDIFNETYNPATFKVGLISNNM